MGGFEVVFGSDLTGIDDPEVMEHELMILRKGYYSVLPCEEIMQLLGKNRVSGMR